MLQCVQQYVHKCKCFFISLLAEGMIAALIHAAKNKCNQHIDLLLSTYLPAIYHCEYARNRALEMVINMFSFYNEHICDE